MSTINILLDVPIGREMYLETSARLREVSRTVLLKRVLEIVLKDHLLLSILDDDDKPSAKTAAKPRGTKRNMPPRDKLFDAVTRPSSVPMRRGPLSRFSNIGRPKTPPTKTEMMDDLKQAVLNTGGELVK